MRPLFCCRLSLSAQQRWSVSGPMEHGDGWDGPSGLLDSPVRFGLQAATVGPGLPALSSSNWSTRLLLLQNVAFHHCVSLLSRGVRLLQLRIKFSPQHAEALSPHHIPAFKLGKLFSVAVPFEGTGRRDEV